MVEQQAEPAESDEHPRVPLSRRGFLGLAGAATAAKIGNAELRDQLVDPSLADTVLSRDDLIEQDSYVEWGVDMRHAPLPTYLRETVASFDGGGGARGFVSDGTSGLPKYIESAVFTAADDWAGLRDGAASWFAATYGDDPTVDLRESDRVAWHGSPAAGFVDALRLDRVEDLVAITVVGGETAGLRPRTAARRYGNAVRQQARLR